MADGERGSEKREKNLLDSDKLTIRYILDLLLLKNMSTYAEINI